MRRPRTLLAVLAGALLLVAGCSNIPPETQPLQLPLDTGQGTTVPVQQPPKNASALQIVRDFIVASANPADKHAAARAYLAPAIKTSWNDGGSVTIIADTFNTLSGPDDSRDLTTQNVLVRGQVAGTLGADDGFQPAVGDPSFTQQFRVARQPDGQWRIIEAPDGVLVTQIDFGHAYSAIPVYFIDRDLDALVPDLRYVASDPRDGLAARVIDELLTGPSDALNGAVTSAIPSGVETITTPAEEADGSLMVNLTRLPDEEYHTKQLIIAQIVRSLQQVSTNPVRILTAGTPLISGHLDWQVSELPAYNLTTTPNGALPGLVATRGRLVSLKDGSAVGGPAGSGDYHVLTAAQSIDGTELAMVCQADTGSGEILRIGDYGKEAAVVNLTASTLTRPTWMPGDAAGDPSREVWTVADGQVIRLLLNPQNGTWYPTSVDASALLSYGTITDLRLSRDGTRVAAIVGGHLLVGAIVVGQPTNSVAIKQVAELQSGLVSGAVGVDWLNQDTLAVATTQPLLPVATVSVDGFDLSKYNTSNLTNPIAAITAADSRPVVVADPAGLWNSTDTGEVWLPQLHNQPAGSIPFYPG